LRQRIGAHLIKLSVVGAFVCAITWHYEVNVPFAITAQGQMEQEFRSIPIPPDTAALQQYSEHKAAQAIVGALYKSGLGYQKLCDHYDKELRRLGWDLVGDEPFADYGRDLGGRLRKYTKGAFKATLSYAGVAAYGWNYGFDLTWHNPSSW
jgi:hypothetical protein